MKEAIVGEAGNKLVKLALEKIALASAANKTTTNHSHTPRTVRNLHNRSNDRRIIRHGV